jgi:cytochrome c-type biogenesis protein CcmH/NrfG
MGAIAKCNRLGNLKIALSQGTRTADKAPKLDHRQLYTTLDKGMTQNTSSQKPLMRFLIILSGIAFAATTLLGLAELFTNAFQEPKKVQTAAEVQKSELEAQAQGYEKVLQREPENQFALQKVVELRLQMNDLQGALAPMEKLVKLNPDNPQYKALLEAIKQRVGTTGTTEKGTTDKKGDR